MPAEIKKLSLQTFDSLQVRLEGKTLELPASRKTRALLAYLALSAGPQSRGRLCELLWGGRDDPRGALRWSLSMLRSVLNAGGHDRLVTNRERVQIDAQAIAVDFHAVRACVADEHAATADLTRAWEQTGSLLMRDCDLPGQRAFMAWIEEQRHEARKLRIELSRRLALSAESSAEEAEMWTQRWLSDAPEARRAVRPTGIVGNGGGRVAQIQTIRIAQAEDGTSLAWASVGDTTSPPIVKVANWLTHLEHEWDAPIWTPLYRELACTFRFVRYDQRGLGLSDSNVAEIGFEKFVSDLDTVVDAAGLDRFAVMGMGHSVPVAIEYAARYPERVSQLILFGGLAAGWRHISSQEKIREYEALSVLIEAGWGREESGYRRLLSLSLIPGANAEELRWFDRLQKSASLPRNAGQCLETTAWFDVRHRLREVKTPTLVLHSRGDVVIPLARGRELAAALPNAQLRLLDSKNHLLLGRESASSKFVEAVRNFIATTTINTTNPQTAACSHLATSPQELVPRTRG